MQARGVQLSYYTEDDGHGFGAAYKDYGASVGWRDGPGLFGVQAQLALGKYFKAGGSYHRDDESTQGSMNAAFAGFGAGLSYGVSHRWRHREGKGPAFGGETYDGWSSTHGEHGSFDPTVLIADGSLGWSSEETTTALQRRPEGYDGWSEDKKSTHQDELKFRSVGRRRGDHRARDRQGRGRERKRANAIRRNAGIAGCESMVVDALSEALKEGPESLQRVIRESGLSFEAFERITSKQGVILPWVG